MNLLLVEDNTADAAMHLARLRQAFSFNSGVVGSARFSGAGVGIAICKSIAAAHGGTLDVSSSLGAGVTFNANLRSDLDGPAQVPASLTMIAA